jgi:undecaprenyl-diphosphatase
MDLSSTDFYLFQFINHLAVILPFLNPVMRLLSEYGEYLFYLGVILYWFKRNKQNRNMVAQALLSALVAFGLGGIISTMYYRDRPFVHHDVIQLIQHPANASFPSDHALGAFVIATSIWLFRKKEGVVWLVLAALVAFSRVWTGVHYPLDILAGAVIGSACALSIHFIFTKWLAAQHLINGVFSIYEKIERKFFRRSRKEIAA